MTAAAGQTADTQRASPEPSRRVAGLVPLVRHWFQRSPEDLAQALLGQLVVREDAGPQRIGRIVETEAYAGEHDRASHARAGRTRRTEPMYGPAGHAYVYLVYGMHHCLNVVAETEGRPGAVLIRALEPVSGVSAMRRARPAAQVADARLLAGPGLLCAGMSIDRRCDGHDLTRPGPLWIAADPAVDESHPAAVITGPRIGVAYAGPGWAERPWRFGRADSPSLSRAFPAPLRATDPTS